jgi:EAL and modified HD-GYP domain-containing signal transduction protein
VQTFISRKPILDIRKNAYAYELLYRPHVDDGLGPCDSDDELTQTTSDICMFLRTEPVTRWKRVFVKAQPEFLLSKHWRMLPKEHAVIEFANLSEATPEAMVASKELKQDGFGLAVNVSVEGQLMMPLLEMVDFIKVDMLSAPAITQSELPKHFASRGKLFVADRIESEESFRLAREMGYHFFQGSFLSRSAKLGLKKVPSLKMHYLRLIQELQKPQVDFNRVEAVIKKDLSLSFSILRYLNSAAFGTSKEIHSIRQAMALLGEKAIKKWVSLLALAEMAKDKPEELIIQAATRGRFCESLASSVGLGDRREELFLMGLFSMLDAILDCDLEDALRGMPLAADIKGALTGTENQFRDVYEYIHAYEDGKWHRVSAYAAKLATDEAILPEIYINAVNWVDESLRGVTPSPVHV